jgi:hypothetical protein
MKAIFWKLLAPCKLLAPLLIGEKSKRQGKYQERGTRLNIFRIEVDSLLGTLVLNRVGFLG